jgi:hypothetical protein
VIPKGKLHKENNNLGNKDKGIPVIDNDGTKHFEVEKEELILTLEVTEKVESLAAGYQSTGNESKLVELGKLLTEEILRNTKDNSGKFNEISES